MSVFSYMARFLGRGLEEDVASIVAVRNVSCPYCGSVYGVLALGAVSRRVRRSMLVGDALIAERCDPEFRETHLANPIRCPVCGRVFTVFVGVERDLRRGVVRGVHVKVAEKDDPVVEACSRWPHKGLVTDDVVEYAPGSITLYSSLDEYLDRIEEMPTASTGGLGNLRRMLGREIFVEASAKSP